MTGKQKSTALAPLLLLASAVSLLLLFHGFRSMGPGYSAFFFSAVPPLANNLEIHTTRQSRRSPQSHRRPAAAAASEGTMRCDRTSSTRTDVCVMMGDVRIHPPSSTIFLPGAAQPGTEEKIRPYPRKFEPGIMATVKELRLIALPHTKTNMTSTATDHIAASKCDVSHNVPALVFYAGGYTGNLFHEFSDGILPLYLTSRQFRRKVVFVVIKYRKWWDDKYKEILSVLSDYPLIDFDGDGRTHCFPSAVVGLRSYGEMALGPAGTDWTKPSRDSRNLLAEAYRPPQLISKGNQTGTVIQPTQPRPHLVIISRNGTRGLENQGDVELAARRVGFRRVTVVQPRPTTSLASMYALLTTADVVAGVHGAALTHMVFMRRGAVLVQVVPLGIAWAAEVCFGRPARAMGLRYVEYRVQPRESSLSERYAADDPVLLEPDRVAAKGGWKVTNDVYLVNQTIRLDTNRFEKVLFHAYNLSLSKT